jgi:tetratricopeptide (TPR) repeat protein
MLQTRVGTASMAKLDDAYRSALGQLAQRYGDDPSAAFLLLDHYFFERQTDKILEAVTTIEKRVGVDGVTRLFRANASMMAGRYDEAVKFAQESIRLEPDLLDSYYSLAEGYLGQKRYPEAVATLSGAGAKFGLVFDRAEFAKDPRYAELMKSAAFRKWLPK